MKVIGYLRVSTDQQAESGLGIEAQLKAIEVYAEKNGCKITSIYRDDGISGAAQLEDRVGLMDALNNLGKGDILLVAKRDRLARGDNMALIQMMVTKKKAKIISTAGEGTEGDQDDPMMYMMRGMTDLFSGFERLLIKSRTKAALSAKKARGERVGHIPFGYQLADDGIHIEMNELEQSILTQMRELRSKGLSIRNIAEEMNQRGAFNRGQAKWNHASVHRVMRMAA
jgi:DNA invertase Pin-like site-specific DNA recombinase